MVSARVDGVQGQIRVTLNAINTKWNTKHPIIHYHQQQQKNV